MTSKARQATVRQTDCGTGWQVLYDGRIITVRRHEEAVRIAAEINAPKGDSP